MGLQGLNYPSPQCILNALLVKGKLPGGEIYTSFGQLFPGGDANTFMSELFRTGEADAFFGRLSSLQRAALMPYIRIFILDAKGNAEEIPFSMQDQSVRGTPSKNPLGLKLHGDVGIASVNIEDLTSQPEEDGSHMVVNLTLFLKSLVGLNQKFPNSRHSIASLITRRDPEDPTFDPLDNRIRMVVGWGNSDPSVGGQRVLSSKLRKAVQKSRMVMDLVLRDHSFSMQENGNVELEIVYNAAVDGFFRSSKTNVLKTLSAVVERKIRAKEKLIGEITKELDDGGLNEDKRQERTERRTKLQEDIHKLLGQENDTFYYGLFQALMLYMKRIDVPKSLLSIEDPSKTFALGCDEIAASLDQAHAVSTAGDRAPPSWAGFTFDSNAQDVWQIIKEKEGGDPFKELYDQGWMSDDPEIVEEQAGYTRLYYFRFGHILEVMNEKLLHTIESNASLTIAQRTNLLRQLPYIFLGPVEISSELCIREDGSAAITTTDVKNMADVPIEAGTFLNWFANRFVRSGARTLTYMTMLNALVKDLMPKALGEGEKCFTPGAQSPVLYPMMSPINYKDENRSIPQWGDRGRAIFFSTDMLRQKLIYPKNFGPTMDNQRLFNGLVIHMAAYSNVNLDYKLASNMGKGIYHVMPGQGNGPLLSFQFSKNNQPFLAEAKTVGDSGVGLGEDISGGNVYNVELGLIGNTFFKVGGIFFVDPIAIGLGNVSNSASLARKLMIGGYYVTTGLSYEITPGDFLTRVEGVYTPGAPKEGGLGAYRVRIAEDKKKRKEAARKELKEKSLFPDLYRKGMDWWGLSAPLDAIDDWWYDKDQLDGE
jgi:hypothetical protein